MKLESYPVSGSVCAKPLARMQAQGKAMMIASASQRRLIQAAESRKRLQC